MPRQYKRKLGARWYREYSPQLLKAACADAAKGMTLRKASEKYGVSKDTIRREMKGIQRKAVGRPTVLSNHEEALITQHLVVAANWGYPLDTTELQLFVKHYLDRSGRKEARFKNNIPGVDWFYSFFKRHKGLTLRLSQNVKRSRAAVSHSDVSKYMNQLQVTLDGIPPENIVNYDESNLTDDPGNKKVITRKGVKHVTRIIDHSKSSTSIMMSATASGRLLPPYVVYKAAHLYDTWREGGPDGCRYNRSNSGWFDSMSFEDWFVKVPLQYFKGCEGRKIIIGDNLSSHLSPYIIELCEKHNISFVFLPPNATHLLQPLDVSFFGPMKRTWKKIMGEWKLKQHRGQPACLPKEQFPRKLKELIDNMKPTMADAIKAGFRKTGIFPFSKEIVMRELPGFDEREGSADSLAESLINFFMEHRFGSSEGVLGKRKRKSRLKVPPGKSITCADIESTDEEEDDVQEVEEEAMASEQGSDIDEVDDIHSDDAMDRDSVSETSTLWKGIRTFNHN